MTSRLFEGGSPSYKVCAVTQHSLRTLAFPGPLLHQQALGKASEEAVSWATGHAVVNQRHQLRLSTQMPLQLMQSCLVSALRVGTQKQPQRIFRKDKSKTSFRSLSWDVCVCVCFHFLSLPKREEGGNNLLLSITTFRDVYRSKTSLGACQLLKRNWISCQIYPLFFSAYK